MHEAPVSMQESDLVKEVVPAAAELRRQGLGFALRAGEFERRERLEQATRLDHFARFGGVETGRLRRDGVHLGFRGASRRAGHERAPRRGARHDGAPRRGATNRGERGHNGEASVADTRDHVGASG